MLITERSERLNIGQRSTLYLSQAGTAGLGKVVSSELVKVATLQLGSTGSLH